ncbi:unnamed protein product [Urochloa decumbens]|uniref:Peptidase A1 domain-containing protein n=1 Tax=Urochloa decumbens TaxID=240449 RepID=A0ABC9FWE7_9POAL
MSSATLMASLAVLISLICVTLASGAAGVRIELTRIHSGPGVTASQFVRDALRRDMLRHDARRRLAASDDGMVSAPTKMYSSILGEYMMALAVGTPPVSYPAIVDTGSDLIWTQCAPCSDQCFNQPTPLYNPANSTTPLSMCEVAPAPGCSCPYNQTYGTGWTAGVQGTETFTFGSSPADQTRIRGIAFGCSNASSDDFKGSSGARGSWGWAGATTSTLLLGTSASLDGAGVGSTPFVTSPSTALDNYYYLNLTGISLGTTALSIPPDAFTLNADGGGGLVIDSGTTITALVDSAYQQVRAAVVSLVTLHTKDGSESELDLCFALPSPTSAPPDMPSMTLHFDGADMVLPPESYMITYTDNSQWCLAMQNQTSGMLPSILGNYQQQNMHILYDVRKEMLSFAPAKCSMF